MWHDQTAFARASLLILLKAISQHEPGILARAVKQGQSEPSTRVPPVTVEEILDGSGLPERGLLQFSQEDEAVYNEERPLRPPAKNSSTLSSEVTHDHAITSAAPGIPARQRSRQHHPEVGHARTGLALDEPLISTAHAAGTDRQAAPGPRAEARTLERAENQPSA